MATRIGDEMAIQRLMGFPERKGWRPVEVAATASDTNYALKTPPSKMFCTIDT